MNNADLVSQYGGELDGILDSGGDIMAIFDAYSRRLTEIIAELEALGVPVLEFPVADGHAFYAVIKRGKKMSRLLWLSGGLDNWQLPVGEEFTMNTYRVNQFIKAQIELERLFKGGTNDQG